MTALQRKHVGLALLATALALLCILGAGTFLSALDQGEWESFRKRGQEAAVTEASAVVVDVERFVAFIDLLHSLAESGRLGQPDTDLLVDRLVANHLRSITAAETFGILQVAAVNERGILIWSTLPGFSQIDLSDREHIRRPLTEPGGLFVSTPVVGRASGRSSIQFSQALRGPDLTLTGVIVVSVDPVALRAMLAVASGDATSSTTLAREDGSELARVTSDGRPLGDTMSDGNSHDLGSNFSASRKVARAPLIVSVTIDLASEHAAILASHTARRLLATAAVMIVAALVLTLIGLVRQRSNRLYHDRLAILAAQAERSRSEIAAFMEALPGVAYRGQVNRTGDFDCVHVGRAFERMTGHCGDFFKCQVAFAALWMPADAATTRNAFFSEAFRQGSATAEYRICRADGSEVWLREQCRVARDPADASSGEVVGLLTDITDDRRVREQALSTAKLATLGAMAAGIAHELNQPAAVIALASDIAIMELEMSADSRAASVIQRVTEIQHQTTRLRTIIDHVQIFGRVDSGDNHLVVVPDAIAGCVAIAGAMLREAGIRLDVRLEDNLPRVWARLVPLEQTLVNMLVNARDAIVAAESQERLVLITAEFMEEREAVALRICDSGPGMRPEVMQRAFEPFFTTKQVGKGTGLGLSIAYGTIKSFGGRLSISNRQSGGLQLDMFLRCEPRSSK